MHASFISDREATGTNLLGLILQHIEEQYTSLTQPLLRIVNRGQKLGASPRVLLQTAPTQGEVMKISSTGPTNAIFALHFETSLITVVRSSLKISSHIR